MSGDQSPPESSRRGTSAPGSSVTSSTTPSTATSSSGDGFLGVVAQWGQDDGERSQNGSSVAGVRTSRMIGSKFGVSPPPPPGPPPTAPPPLPPSTLGNTTHPFANSGSISKRPNQPASHPTASRTLPAALSSIHTSARGPPTMGPPTTELPALPSSVTGHRRTISTSSRSSNNSKRQSTSPPRVSPRSSSLISPPQSMIHASPVAGPSAHHTSPESMSSRPKPPRTPSRHLLQTALDLAQRAVEMDKSNDVLGALAAYREAVARLKNVMERVGVDPTDGRRRKSSGRAEEEGRTLRGIHDAYVARIELLSSYEDEQNGQLDNGFEDNNDEPFPPHASTSTATLVPTQKSPRADRLDGTNTPRPSLDDTSTGIGNLMLNDPGDMTMDNSSMGSPTRRSVRLSADEGVLASPFLSRPQRTSSLQHLQESDIPYIPQPGSPIQPPPRRTSIGAMRPTSPQAAPVLGSPVSASRASMTSGVVSPHSGSSSSSHRRRVPSRSAMGIESELDIPMEEAEDGMEVLSRTPRYTAVPTNDGDVAHHPLASAQLSPRRGSDSYTEDNDRPLPPLPNSAPVLDSYGRPHAHQRQISGGRPPSGTFLVSPNVNQGTISQRRSSRGIDGVPAVVPPSPQVFDGLPGQAQSETSSTAPSAFGTRSRTRSQPGSVRSSVDQVPPLPTNSSIRHRTSFGSRSSARVSSSGSQSSQPSNLGLRIETDARWGLNPPSTVSSSRSSARSGGSTLPRSPSGTLFSPVPEAQPTELILRAFHILRVICLSMDPNKSGAYLTSHIHISPAVWQPGVFAKPGQKSAGPPRIVAQEAKLRVLQTMCFHLDIMKAVAKELIDGDRDYIHGKTGSDMDSVSVRHMVAIADELLVNLENMDDDMVMGYKVLAKYGVQVQPWKDKSKRQSNALSWSNKLKDKMINGRTLESPDKYVDLLSQFAFLSQVLNDHLLNFTGQCTGAYAVLPRDLFRSLEVRLHNAAQFVGSALIPFILDDTMQFLTRYLKQGMKYLEE